MTYSCQFYRNNFTLTRTEQIIEIRVYYTGRDTLIVDKIKIKRIPHNHENLVNTLRTSDDAVLNVDSHCLEIISPQNNKIEVSRSVDFIWKWACQPLAKNQTFEIRIWQKGDSFHYGAHNAAENSVRQVDDIYTMRLNLNGVYSVNLHGEGDYLWAIAIVEIEPSYLDLNVEGQPNHLQIISN